LPVIVLAGEEEYEIWQRAKALKKELVDPQWESFNFARIDNPDLKEVIDAAATVPFGPGNRMVLFDQCALFTKKRGAKDDDASSGSASKSAKLVDDFAAALKSVPPNTYLVFSCIANFDSSLKTSKAAAAVAKLENFEKVRYASWSQNEKLISFCNKEAKRCNAYIEDDACFYLAESTDTNLRQIAQEIQKAATYILPEQTIRLEHVQLLSPHISHVFQLLEYWAAGKHDKVLESLAEMRAKQMSPHMVLATMQTQLTKWVHYKTEHQKLLVPSGGRDVGRRSVSLKEVASRIEANPKMAFVVQKDLERIEGLTLEFLIAKKQHLTDLEHKVKTGQVPEGHVLDLFFTR
jgi:DNA polymerase III subunit delta